MIISRRLRWVGHLARMDGGRSAFPILTDEPTGKRPLLRLKYIWDKNIRMNLKEIDVNSGN